MLVSSKFAETYNVFYNVKDKDYFFFKSKSSSLLSSVKQKPSSWHLFLQAQQREGEEKLFYFLTST